MKENTSQRQKLTRSLTSLWEGQMQMWGTETSWCLLMGCRQRHTQSIHTDSLCPQGCCPKLSAAMLAKQGMNPWLLTLSVAPKLRFIFCGWGVGGVGCCSFCRIHWLDLRYSQEHGYISYVFLLSRYFKGSLYVMPSQAVTTKEIRAWCWYTEFSRFHRDFSGSCATDRTHPRVGRVRERAVRA